MLLSLPYSATDVYSIGQTILLCATTAACTGMYATLHCHSSTVACVQSKNAAEEAKLAKKQEESEAVRQAHREEARLKEEVTRRRLEAKVTPLPLMGSHTTA